MKKVDVLWFSDRNVVKYGSTWGKRNFIGRLPLAAVCVLLATFLMGGTGCSSWSNDVAATTSPTMQANVNGFGTAANHPHALLVFPDHVLVLATHFGTFRSGDGGKSWKQVGGGSGQIMDGLMSFSLTASPLNQRRIYLLTQLALTTPKGTLGLYTSTDQGQTWQLATAASNLTPNKTIYLAEAGNDSADQVYVYLPALGTTGLKVSMDNGKHFRDTGTFPFGDMTFLLAVPGAKGHLVAGSSSGMAQSSDSGKQWKTIKGITGGIFNIVSAGPHQPIYADGDNGLYVSQDGGQTFTGVNQQATYGISLTVSPTQPQVLYGHTAQAIYRSTNGGKTWQTMPLVKGQLYNLVADPAHAQEVYLTMSYPTEVYHFNQARQTWSSLTPKS
ncbi:MAG TPA: hypothetical protein VHZ51_30755 [Ktedonobacteraceae bacterium]|nr:hypothetical protein [Ktedonobacteraceae bacterium]